MVNRCMRTFEPRDAQVGLQKLFDEGWRVVAMTVFQGSLLVYGEKEPDPPKEEKTS